MSSTSPAPQTRDQHLSIAARAWLDARPDTRVGVTPVLLARVLGQVQTFVLAKPDHGGSLGDRGRAVIASAGIPELAALGLRAMTKSQDVPDDLVAHQRTLAEHLAPLAAAILLARTPTIDLGAAMARCDGQLQEPGSLGGTVTRTQLKDRVVSSLTQEALAVLGEAGAGLPTATYLDLLLVRAPRAARASYERALADLEDLPPLTPAARARLEAVVARELPRLRRRAAQLTRTTDQADELLGRTLLKVGQRLQRKPGFAISGAYVMGALTLNARTPPPAADTAHSLTSTGEVPEDAMSEAGPDDLHVTLARAVHRAAAELAHDTSTASERRLAGEALGTAYLRDPAAPEALASLTSTARLLVDNGDPMLADLLRAEVGRRGLDSDAEARVLDLAQEALAAAVRSGLATPD